MQWGPVVQTFVVDLDWVTVLALFEDSLDLLVHAVLAVVSKLLVVFLDLDPEIVPVLFYFLWVYGYF